jgi:hypothetical protein
MMRFRLLAGGAALAALPFLAVASPTNEPKSVQRPQCAVADMFSRLYDADENSATIETAPGQRFKVSFQKRCEAARESISARIITRPVSVCIDRGDRIEFRWRETNYSCTIRTIERLPLSDS